MRAHVLLICPRMRSSALTALYVYTRSGQAVKRKKGPGQTVKRGFRAESSGQDRFHAVKNLDPGRGRSYGKYWSDRPLSSAPIQLPGPLTLFFCLPASGLLNSFSPQS